MYPLICSSASTPPCLMEFPECRFPNKILHINKTSYWIIQSLIEFWLYCLNITAFLILQSAIVDPIITEEDNHLLFKEFSLHKIRNIFEHGIKVISGTEISLEVLKFHRPVSKVLYRNLPYPLRRSPPSTTPCTCATPIESYTPGSLVSLGQLALPSRSWGTCSYSWRTASRNGTSRSWMRQTECLSCLSYRGFLSPFAEDLSPSCRGSIDSKRSSSEGVATNNSNRERVMQMVSHK